MTRNFVAINDPVHNLLRNLSRRCPLKPSFDADGRIRMQYSVDERALPEDYYSLAMLHGIGGMSLDLLKKANFHVGLEDRKSIPEQVSYFKAIMLDRRCSRDLRLYVGGDPAGMASAEILSFGTGTLRARNDDADEPFYRFLWTHHGRIHTAQELVHARIWSLHRLTRPGRHELSKESFDSTNVVYGDVYGELEQLWDRRADTAFFDQVVQSMQLLRRRGTLGTVVHPPLSPSSVHHLHLERQAIWKAPPATPRALLRRLEFILDHTTLDKAASTVYTLRNAKQRLQRSDHNIAGWEADSSGYDGWLADEGSVL